MSGDEEQIREVVSTWMTATKARDAETVPSLISDDAQSQASAPQFDGTNDILETKVIADWALMRSELTVVTTPAGGGPVGCGAVIELTGLTNSNRRRGLQCRRRRDQPPRRARQQLPWVR